MIELPVDRSLDRVVSNVLAGAGERITGINDETRDRILGTVRDTVAEGMREGLGAAELGDKLEDALANASAFGEYRSEMIARTETMNAYNHASLDTYREFGMELVECVDGDEDEMCVERQSRDNGWGPGIYTLDDAADETDLEHPNGTLDWLPYFPEDLETAAEQVEAAGTLEEGVSQIEIRAATDRLIEKAHDAAPRMTSDIRAIGKRTGLEPNASFTLKGKEYHTLDARLKTGDSTARKIAGELKDNPALRLRDIEPMMRDNLRYTYIADARTYNASVREGIEALRAAGYRPMRATDYWTYRGKGYAGMNTNWITPSGQIVEIQFHTQSGLELKEVQSHLLYERQRVLPKGSPEFDDLGRQIDDLWAEYRGANGGLGEMPWLDDVFPEVYR